MGEGTYILHISTNAFADTAEIALLYEQKVASLGDHFLDDLENNFKSITTHPTYFSDTKKEARLEKSFSKFFLTKFST